MQDPCGSKLKKQQSSEDLGYGSGRTHTTSQGQGPPQSSPTSLKGAPRSNRTLTLGILRLLQHKIPPQTPGNSQQSQSTSLQHKNPQGNLQSLKNPTKRLDKP